MEKGKAIQIIASILASDFSKLTEEFKKLEMAQIDGIHFDVMDNHFVPNLTFGSQFIKDFRPYTDLDFHVHLMIENPEKSIDQYINLKINTFIIHVETVNKDIFFEIARKVKGRNHSIALAINPDTKLSTLEAYLEFCDYVLVMLVNPGFAAQKILWNTLDKVEKLVDLRVKKNLNFLIQVDGSVNLNTIYRLKDFEIDSLVIGSALFQAENYKDFVKKIRNIWML